ncbi:killer cell lectin-like receptor subfamily B member 1A [Pogona vitticeps]
MVGGITYTDLNIQETPSSLSPSVSHPSENSGVCTCTQRYQTALGVSCIVILLLSGAVTILIIWGFQGYKTSGTDCFLASEMLHLKTSLCYSPNSYAADYVKDCKLCPQNWKLYKGKCYWVSQERKSWTQSQDDCRAKNSTLPVIQDVDQTTFIKNITQKSTSYWLGLVAEYSERWIWKWTDGSPLKEKLFAVSGPAENNSCVMTKDGEVSSEDCSSLHPWVCMKTAFTL